MSAIIELVSKDAVLAPMLAVVTPTLQFGGIAGNFAAGVSRTVYVNGMVVEDQNRMRDWNDYDQRIFMRHLPLSGTPAESAVIGTGVARVLQMCGALKVPDCSAAAARRDEPRAMRCRTTSRHCRQCLRPAPLPCRPRAGTRVEILATSPRGAPNVAAVDVVQAEFQGIKELDDVYVALAPRAGAAAGLRRRCAAGDRHRLAVAAHRPDACSTAAAEGAAADQPRGEQLAVIDYETLNPFYGQTLGMFAAIFGFISVLIGAIVLFTVTNTMSMAVVERTAEIGTLRAIGLQARRYPRHVPVRGPDAWDVLAPCSESWRHLALPGLSTSSVCTGRRRAGSSRCRCRCAWSGENGMLLAHAVGLVIVGAVSALLPAARAARMNIVDALRHV